MKIEMAIAICSGLCVPLSGATLTYVVSIEHRLTRLEVKDELRTRPLAPPPPPSHELKA